MTYSIFSDMSTALQSTMPVHTILDVEFDTDELVDIVNHGMSSGVPGFIYYRDNVKHFDDNEDAIEEYLSDWYFDNMGERDYIGMIADGGHNQHPVGSVNELKNRMVWMYVELKAHDILINIEHPDFY